MYCYNNSKSFDIYGIKKEIFIYICLVYKQNIAKFCDFICLCRNIEYCQIRLSQFIIWLKNIFQPYGRLLNNGSEWAHLTIKLQMKDSTTNVTLMKDDIIVFQGHITKENNFKPYYFSAGTANHTLNWRVHQCKYYCS